MSTITLNTAILCGRVSTDFKRQAGSIQVQDPRLRSYCERKHLTIGAYDTGAPYIFFDEESGTVPIPQRKQGRIIVELLRAGKAKHLIFTNADRLGRRLAAGTAFMDFCEHLGVTLHLVDELGEFDHRDPSQRMHFHLLLMFAENEHRRIVGRIKNTLDEKRAAGQVTGTVPYGWDAVVTGRFVTKNGLTKETRELVENPEQQRWLRQMILWRSPKPPFEHMSHSSHPSHSGYSYQTIADALNAAGVPPKIPAGQLVRAGKKEWLASGVWHAGNVHHVLNNSFTRDLALTLSVQKVAA